MQKVFFGHHKCASSYIVDIMLQLRKETSATIRFNPEKYTEKVSNANIVIFQNSTIDSLNFIQKKFRGLHLIRDPRDIVVSAYFSHLKTHEEQSWLIDHRKKLQKIPKDEGLFEVMDFMADQMKAFNNWNYYDNRIFELKFETMIEKPEVLIEGLKFLGFKDNSSQILLIVKNLLKKFNNRGIPMPKIKIGVQEQRLIKIIDKHSFKSKAKGRDSGKSDSSSHYRKGISGDWKNHFNEDHIRYIKDKYGDVLIKMGYEKDLNW